MPLYEGLSLGSDKHSVLLEFGNAYTKCGFVNDYCPRAIIRTQIFYAPFNKVVDLTSMKEEKHLSFALRTFIEMLYFRFLAVNPKDRRVIIVESIFCESMFRKVLADVLFKYFDVPFLLFVPHHLMALMTLMIPSGVVVDVGFKECTVIPVIEGVTCLDSVQFAPLGGKAIHERIRQELEETSAKITIGKETRSINENDSIDDKILENIKVRLCFVTPFDRRKQLLENDVAIKSSPSDVKYPIDGTRVLDIPGKTLENAAEVLFEEVGNESTVATLVLEALLKCSLDARKCLASNIVLVGGTCMIPGFRHRLSREILALIENNNRYKSNIFFKSFLFHNPPCKENYACWLGASIFGSTDAVNSRSISRDQYLKSNGKVLRDWSDWYPSKNSIVDIFYSLNEKFQNSLKLSTTLLTK